jgi:SAM-dependent methyltransferase
MRGYEFDKISGIWQRPDYCGIDYSEGAETEQRLLATLKSVADVSVWSDQLRTKISDWQSEYHFSAARHCILRPLSIGPQDKVLELGCGCGAITRYLGECGASVVAVEGSKARARIAAERCRDLGNVAVCADRINEFCSDEKYDWVLLIGVLEYSRVFADGDDPISSVLQKAKEFLAPEGRLVVAIENQLGLKYFNGCSEDHLGKKFFGIEDLYGSKTVVTFGRAELGRRLERAGFPSVEFYYPFPDYKIPGVLLSERAVSTSAVDLPNLLFNTESRDYTGDIDRSFSEPLAWAPIARNGLVGHLANSFVVVAAAQPHACAMGDSNWLAQTFASYRRAEFATQTTLSLATDNHVAVSKAYAVPGRGTARVTADQRFQHRLTDDPYHEGSLYVIELLKMFAAGSSPAGVAQWMMPWVAMLKASADTGTEGREDGSWFHWKLPGRFLDCTPFNLIRRTDGNLYYFDQEWAALEPIPVYWVIIRGLGISASYLARSRAVKALTRKQFITWVLQSLGVRVTQDIFEDVVKRENDFTVSVRPVAEMEGQSWYDVLDAPVGSVALP